MRKLIVFCHVSLDGIAASPSGELDWISYSKELEEWAELIVAETDTAIYGHTTYELMKYWQSVPNDPKASEHELSHAKWIEKIEKIVISKSPLSIDWNNTKNFNNNIEAEIVKLKQQSGKNITLFGSATLVHSLLHTGLIDEFQLSISPVLLGTGKSLFTGVTDLTKLALIKEQVLSSGVVTLHYKVQ